MGAFTPSTSTKTGPNATGGRSCGKQKIWRHYGQGNRKRIEGMSSVAFAEKSSIAPALKAGVGTKSASGGLRIGEPNDSFEREADHIADEVMLGAATRRSWSFSRMSI